MGINPSHQLNNDNILKPLYKIHNTIHSTHEDVSQNSQRAIKVDFIKIKPHN